MSTPLNRRDILKNTALAGAGFFLAGNLRSRAEENKSASPNEKLNVALVGCGGRAEGNLAGVAGENIVALCDVDDARAAGAFKQYPNAKKFRDYRNMLDAMHKEIDAVVVSTPDHTHAVAAMAAMNLGKHCYCEKPLAHTVHEARRMAEVAKEKKLATQMGTQIHARRQLPPRGRAGPGRRDRPGRRGSRLERGEVPRRRAAQGVSADARGTRLGPLARPGAVSSLSA